MQHTFPPLAILFNSLAYFYNSVNNVVPLPNLTDFPLPLRGRGIISPVLNASTTLVETEYGVLRGLKTISRNGRGFHSFRGIPFASPPTGFLRFEPPEPPYKWDGIRDATRYGSQCLQMNVITRRNIVGHEDCLFLSVFTHNVLEKSELEYASLNPVIVFIHGGIFMSGSSNIYRPKYFLDSDVVLVVPNYRLGSFGFLNTGDGTVRGNMGLKDQVMALKWVQKNIIYFGGDPTRVTVMGESAGACSSHLHALSPLSKGLFHRVISMSGTALSPWGLYEESETQAKEFAAELGCLRETTVETVACLKVLDSSTITRVHFGYINGLANNKKSVFGPSVETVIDDQTFLPAPPRELLKAGKINKVPWMTGVNSHEGLVYLIPIIRNSTMNRLVNEQWENYAAKLISLHPSEVNPKLLRDIKSFYMNDSDIEISTITKAADMISDRAFFLDNHDAVILHSQVENVYPYYYKYNGRYAMAKLLFVKSPLPFRIPARYEFDLGTASSWFNEYVLRLREPNYFGIGHSDEIPLFFNTPFIRREVTPEDEDYLFSKTLISLWVSFADTGVPNTRDLHIPSWNPVRFETKDHALPRYHLDVQQKMADEPFFERLKFWKSRNITYF